MSALAVELIELAEIYFFSIWKILRKFFLESLKTPNKTPYLGLGFRVLTDPIPSRHTK